MKRVISFALCAVITSLLHAQGVAISGTYTAADPAALLDLQSTTQGFLPPRMTTAERDAIPAPPEGLLIYNTTTRCTNFFIGSNWQELCGTCTPVVAGPAQGIHVPADNSVQWNWSAVPDAAGYKWSNTNNYALATDLGNVTGFTQSGLVASTPYTIYVWAYNVCGPSVLPVTLTATTTGPPCTVGTIGPAGGRVFYCGSAYPGKIGLEAAPMDQGTAPWGCQNAIIAGADGAAVGTGRQNTLDIVNGCATSNIAARLCENLDLNGYNDWFLPSGYIGSELSLMYTNLHAQGLGGFMNDVYWSSTERDSAYGRLIHFQYGDANDHSDKNASFRVRCVRAF
jgi:hypothetical protein